MSNEVLRRLIGEHLQKCRKKKGFTQEELAKRTSLKRTSITNVERSRQMISLSALYELAEALDVEVHELLPSRQDLSRQREAMSKIPPSKHNKADIAHWVDTVTTDSD